MTAITDTVRAAPDAAGAARARAPRPDVEPEPSGRFARFLVGLFVVVPLLAVLAAVPLAWGWGLGWHDSVVGFVFSVAAGMGISMGFHRHFTHCSFKAVKPLRVALAIAGSLAIEGPVLVWVADHRRHHKYSDKEGDPHSPWRYGDDWKALSRGLAYAPIGGPFDPNKTSQERSPPDLPADRRTKTVAKRSPALARVPLLLPAPLGAR